MLKTLIIAIALLLAVVCNAQSFDAKVFVKTGPVSTAVVKIESKLLSCSFENGTILEIKLNQVHARAKSGVHDFVVYEGTSHYFDAEIMIFYDEENDIQYIKINPYETSTQDILLENNVIRT